MPRTTAPIARRKAARGGRRPVSSRRGKEMADRGTAVFPSALGWIAILGRGDVVQRVTFGHDSPQQAMTALEEGALEPRNSRAWNPRLVARLQAFIEHGKDDFRDVPVDLGSCTTFQRRVLEACRRIPYGRTMSYGELAAAAGYPRAARAVGSVMANNQFSLIVPCHRVLAAGGRLGGYSNRLGLAMKKRLLALEAENPLRPRRAAKRR
ncbi:MAG TPA: methylated-DNA--[protein]-cysteine S-methyltransferase [Pirellulales bacterium]|nr:methylated-DNA--[protein]-cysteine S-methyltransferase [Pirellulales bacterium]